MNQHQKTQSDKGLGIQNFALAERRSGYRPASRVSTASSQRRNSPNHFPPPSGPGDFVACTVHVFRNRRAPKAGASRARLRCDDDRF
ncbi:hypothetical protein IscW_ISCW012106 [Ixodes scapularis]|uniref:Uncharacterized protein n=1 Tax=Ixodes scapularis TaxID=6945 RepID=B7QEB1_IXOSC|nr:hypothetical protein IscW_ISCW012106 [Ixodes scapularis]|eukprot:XP_002413875.1 hypothetical protein IscW_ISCW012106 [Ixodes scapularis]